MTVELAGAAGRGEGTQRTVALGGGLRVPYPEPRDAAATKVGKGNRRTDTKPEVALRSELHRRGLRFRKDHPIRVEGRRPIRPDVVFTRARVAVFVDGCFWHRCPKHGNDPRSNSSYWGPKLARNVERDREVNTRLAAAGWRVVRIWEHSVGEPSAKMRTTAQIAELVQNQEGADGGTHHGLH